MKGPHPTELDMNLDWENKDTTGERRPPDEIAKKIVHGWKWDGSDPTRDCTCHCILCRRIIAAINEERGIVK